MFGEIQLMTAYVLFLVTSLASPVLLFHSKKTAVCIAQSALIAALIYLFATEIVGAGYYADMFITFNVLIVLNTIVTLYAANSFIRNNKLKDTYLEEDNDTYEEEEEKVKKTFFSQNIQTNTNGTMVFLPDEKTERKEYFLRTIKEKNGIEL